MSNRSHVLSVLESRNAMHCSKIDEHWQKSHSGVTECRFLQSSLFFSGSERGNEMFPCFSDVCSSFSGNKSARRRSRLLGLVPFHFGVARIDAENTSETVLFFRLFLVISTGLSHNTIINYKTLPPPSPPTMCVVCLSPGHCVVQCRYSDGITAKECR